MAKVYAGCGAKFNAKLRQMFNGRVTASRGDFHPAPERREGIQPLEPLSSASG